MESQTSSQQDLLHNQSDNELKTDGIQQDSSSNSRKRLLFLAIFVSLLVVSGSTIAVITLMNTTQQSVNSPKNDQSSQSPTENDNLPVAWANDAYSGKIGSPIEFTARGSSNPSGVPISLYEWDLDGDGSFEYQVKNETITHIYKNAFKGPIYLRVTGVNGTATSRAFADINELGYASQGDEEPCPIDENGYSIIIDENGIFMNCTATHLPTEDKEGVSVILE